MPGIQVGVRGSAAAVLMVVAGLCLLAAPVTAQDGKAEEQERAAQARAEAIDTLIGHLGARSFEVREAAEKELRENFASARDALRRARSSSDPEIRWRATRIFDDLEPQEVEPPEQGERAPGARTPDGQRGVTPQPGVGERRDSRSRAWQSLDAQLRDLLDSQGRARPRPLAPGTPEGQQPEGQQPEGRGADPSPRREHGGEPFEGLRQWESEDGTTRGWSFRSNGEVPDELWESLDREMGQLRGWGTRLQQELDGHQRGLHELWGEDPWAMLEDDNLEGMVQEMLRSLDARIEGLDLEALLGDDRLGDDRLGEDPFGALQPPARRSTDPRVHRRDSTPGPAGGPRLGIVTAETSEVLRAQLGFDGGVAVTEVIPGSAAHRAGLQTHDIVLSVSGEPILTGADLRAALDRIGEGGEGNLEILRRGTKQRVAFQLR